MPKTLPDPVALTEFVRAEYGPNGFSRPAFEAIAADLPNLRLGELVAVATGRYRLVIATYPYDHIEAVPVVMGDNTHLSAEQIR